MRRYLLAIVTFVMTLTSLTSCLEAEEQDFIYYQDAAITSFSLGTLNRYIHATAKDGSDSIYKRTLNCSNYKFNIDHEKGLIWNEDSLPLDIDAAHVICTVTAKNSGTIGIKSLTSDSLKYHNTKDSIDFTKPREFLVYSMDGITSRKYTVSVNLHKEVADTCIWTKLSDNESYFADAQYMKAFAKDGWLHVFHGAGGLSMRSSTRLADGQEWSHMTSTDMPGDVSLKNMILFGNAYFLIDGSKLMKSEEGLYWNSVNDNPSLKTLVAASTLRLYAISNDGKLMSSDDEGNTWIEENLDSDASLLPTEDISFACRKLETNEGAEKIVLIGNRNSSLFPGDKTAVVWTKIDQKDSEGRYGTWNYVEFAADNKYAAPRVANWQLVNYDKNNIKAIAGASKDGGADKALGQIFHSGDDGITWMNDTIMSMPKGFSSSETVFTMAADGVNSVWIICGGTGQVWKGRINRVAWKKEPDYYLE